MAQKRKGNKIINKLFIIKNIFGNLFNSYHRGDERINKTSPIYNI